jgi:hypothetical protein
MSAWARRTRTGATRLCGCLLLGCTLAGMVRADSLETISLQYRTAEDLLPLLQPLLPQGAAVTGTGDVLLVRGDAGTIAQLREAVARLDRAPRQLLITVSQVTSVQGAGTSVRGSGTIGSGDLQVGVNRPPQDTPGGQVVVRSGTRSDELGNVASVRALEGYETYVSLGQSRPFTSTSVTGGGFYPPVVTQSTEFRSVATGFYATPRVNGDLVTLEISSQQQRLGGNLGTQVNMAGITTTVSGRLGEWIELGGSTDSSSGASSGLVTWGTRSDSTQYVVRFKVDVFQ